MSQTETPERRRGAERAATATVAASRGQRPAVDRAGRAGSLGGARPWIALGAAAALVFAWIVVRNRIAPLGSYYEVDEAAYLQAALHMRDAGLGGLPGAVVHSGTVGPMVPLVSFVFLWFAPHSAFAAILAQPLLHLAAALGVAGIAATLTRARPGVAVVVGGVLALGLPRGLAQSSGYQLALGCSAALCLAVLALLRSERGQRRSMVLWFGIALGCLMLTRVMAAAYLPGLGLAVLWYVRWNRTAIRNFALGTVAAMALALPWWIVSWEGISSYVGDFGYGAARPTSISSPVLRFLAYLTGGPLIHVRPLLVVPAYVATGAVLVHLLRRRRTPESVVRRPLTDRVRGAIAVLIAVGTTVVALSTTSNMGESFIYPVLVLAVAPIVAGGLSLGGSVARGAGVVALGAAALNVLLVPYAYRLDLPTSTTEGVGEFFFGGAVMGPDPVAWTATARRIVAGVDAARPRGSQVDQITVGEEPVMNIAVIGLTEALRPNPTGPLGPDDGVRPFPVERSGRRVVVITIDGPPSRAGSEPSTSHEAEVEGQGWTSVRTVRLPDGGSVSVMVPSEPSP